MHSPFYPPKARRGEGKRALYEGVLDTMDEQLGELFDYIRSREALRDNTVVLVASDNGPEPGAGSAGPYRGVKVQLYEGGIRSPLIVWAPGLLAAGKAGSKNESDIVAAFDVAPSLLRLAGGDPAEAQSDGIDASAALLGMGPLPERGAPIFWRRPPDRPGTRAEPCSWTSPRGTGAGKCFATTTAPSRSSTISMPIPASPATLPLGSRASPRAWRKPPPRGTPRCRRTSPPSRRARSRSPRLRRMRSSIRSARARTRGWCRTARATCGASRRATARSRSGRPTG
ncbi:MAG: sulfatase-like hydrolase/transferase [Verrucomicrobiales bacterium]